MTRVALAACRRVVLCGTLGLLAFAVGSRAGAAEKPFAFGLQAHWGDEMGFGVGARAVVNLGGLLEGLEAVTSFDRFFPGDEFGVAVGYWEANANLVCRFGATERRITPYAGLGFNLARTEASTSALGTVLSGDDSEAGTNLLAGLSFGSGRVRPFVEIKVELEGGRQAVATAGLRF